MGPVVRMQLLYPILVIFLLVLSGPVTLTDGHNITKILAQFPEFSTFNHYLTTTHLATEINQRRTITVLVVDNSAMASLLAKHLTIYTIKNILSLHILTDYYSAKKLHQINGPSANVSSLFQATGDASGISGFVRITDVKGGKVSFAAEDNPGGASDTSFTKSVKEQPFNISVIQISSLLTSPEAEAPTPAPSQYNLTELMTSKGCQVFADLLAATPDVEKTFEGNVGGGLTVFCPIDQAMKGFMPKYKNLTVDGKASLLLYHGVPVYYSIQMLKSNNGEVNTLATDGTAKNYNFTVQNDGEVVTIQTRIDTARITGTVKDEQPLAVYTLDKVLQPRDLFKVAEVPTPAPAPVAHSPKKAHHKVASPPAPAGPDGSPADQAAADDNSGFRASGGRWVAAVAAFLAGFAVVV